MAPGSGTVTKLPGKYITLIKTSNVSLTVRRCSAKIPELRILVDLDVENGKPPRPNSGPVRVSIKQTKQVRMAAIDAYLKKQMNFDPTVLEGISKCI